MMNRNVERRLAGVCLALFIAFLIWGLYFKFGLIDVVRSNFNPYITIARRLRGAFHFNPMTADYRDILLNILVTAPLGVFLPILYEKGKILPQAFVCFTLSLCIEIVQLFTAIGGFYLPDLICNTLGYFVGLLFYKKVFSKLGDRARAVMLTCATVLVAVCVTVASIQLSYLMDDYAAMIREWITAPKYMN